MAEIKALLDQYGIINEGDKILPDDTHRIKLISALAELEDNTCHKHRNYPKTSLHKVKGVKQAIYRAYIDKASGWRLHLQFDKTTNTLQLKDIIEGQLHDDVVKIIKAKKHRYG